MGQCEPTDALLDGATQLDEIAGNFGDDTEWGYSSTENDPIPLNEHAGRAESFPLECLGHFGSNAAEALQDLIQAPAGLCAQGVLAAMSTCVSGWGQVEAIHGRSHPLATYHISVAQSGERKTAVDGFAQHGIKVFEKEVAEEVRQLRQEAETAGTSMDDLPEPDILVNEPTYEGLMRVLARGQGFGCLSNDDAAGFFGSHAMSKDQRQKMISGLSQLWSGSDIKRPRMHGLDSTVSGVPLTIGLMFQPYLIGQVFGDVEMVEQGILARVLPCYPVSTMGKRLYRRADPSSSATADAFAKRCYEVLKGVKVHKASRLRPTDPFKPSFPVLPLSSDARGVLIGLHDEIEAGLAAGGPFSRIRAFASRAVENATRLAGIITLFDDLESSEVSRVAADAGATLARYYIEEFSYLHGLGKSAKDHGAAGQLGEWLAKQYGPGGIGHDQEVSQLGPLAFRKRGDRRPIMELLAAHCWIEMLPAGTIVNGTKRNVAFRVSDKIQSIV